MIAHIFFAVAHIFAVSTVSLSEKFCCSPPPYGLRGPFRFFLKFTLTWASGVWYGCQEAEREESVMQQCEAGLMWAGEYFPCAAHTETDHDFGPAQEMFERYGFRGVEA